jgi:hypothetical protein
LERRRHPHICLTLSCCNARFDKIRSLAHGRQLILGRQLQELMMTNAIYVGTLGLESMASSLDALHHLETTVQASQTFERGGKRDRREASAHRSSAFMLRVSSARIEFQGRPAAFPSITRL